MNDRWALVKELAPVALILGAVVWGLVDARRRLRPWYAWLAGLGAVVSIPISAWLLSEARAGNFTGWGGLGALLFLLPAIFVAALSVTVLVTLAILLPRYGFDARTAAERAEDRQRRKSPEGQRAQAIFKLKLSAIGLVIALSVLLFRKFTR